MADQTIHLADHDGWLLSFVNGERRAYLDVKLFLSAVGRLQISNLCQAHFDAKDMHKYFAIFAKEMGWPGVLYEVDSSTGRCPAVTLYLRDDVPRKGSFFWMIDPFRYHMREPWRLDESPVKHKVLEAARATCKEWLPDWEW